MTGPILQTFHVVVDPLVWQVPLSILALIVVLKFVYYVYIQVAYRMAKDRHRDLLGWVLLSVFCSPLLAWIILLIVGDNTPPRPDTN